MVCSGKNGDKFETGLYSKPIDCHQLLEYNSAHPIHIKSQLFIVKRYVLRDYVRRHWHLKNTLGVCVLGLGNVIISRNLMTINLEG